MSIETYREEHEMGKYEESFQEKLNREEVYGEDVPLIVLSDAGYLVSEDKEEHEHDREAEDLEEPDGNIPEGDYDFI